MSADESVLEFPLLSPEAADAHVFRCLSLLIGRGKRFSVNDVHIGTGIPARTISSWLAAGEDRREPKAHHLLLLFGFFGIEFSSKVLGQVGQIARHIDPADSMKPAQIVGEVLSALAVLGQAATDNRIDHTEAPACRDAADRIIAAVVPLSSVARAA